MGSGIMTAANIIAENGASLAYLKETFMGASDVVRNLVIKNDEVGLKYPVRGQDGGVTATMPAYNSGFSPTFALASTSTEQAFKIGFSVNLSLASYVGKPAASEVMMQVTAGLQSAASVFDTAFFYGSGNGTTGFKGLNARIASNAGDYAIAVSVSGAVNTSVYAVVSGDYDTHLYIPQGLELDGPNSITLENVTVDASGYKMAGKTVTVESYIGFVVHQSRFANVGQAFYLNGTDYFTYAIFRELYAAMELGKNGRASRTTLFINHAQYALFAKNCASLITSVQALNDINMTVASVDGVKIVATSTITNTESNKA